MMKVVAIMMKVVAIRMRYAGNNNYNHISSVISSGSELTLPEMSSHVIIICSPIENVCKPLLTISLEFIH